MTDYVLGTHERELKRLELQQTVWGSITASFLDRLGVAPGSRVLDLGCGPGLVTLVLRERVGPDGRVVAVDEAEHWLRHLDETAKARGFGNVETRRGRIEDLDFAEQFDVVFARWVFSFLPDPAAIIRRLAKHLTPGGVVAIQDYNHEGVSLFPESRGFRAAIRATRELYASSGGDTWIAGKLPRMLREAGLELCDYTPNVLCGGPGSPAFRWADAFFPEFVDAWVEQGLLSEEECALFKIEWQARREDPSSVFFSPIVVDIAARARSA